DSCGLRSGGSLQVEQDKTDSDSAPPQTMYFQPNYDKIFPSNDRADGCLQSKAAVRCTSA
ncbi:MAG: hypothetical protein LH613_10240, partial [Chamaesiphon sp.]|nr:hypothetical protein [Chamaesiphon sp.]